MVYLNQSIKWEGIEISSVETYFSLHSVASTKDEDSGNTSDSIWKLYSLSGVEERSHRWLSSMRSIPAQHPDRNGNGILTLKNHRFIPCVMPAPQELLQDKRR